MNVFDRAAKRRQKNRAYASPDAQTYDYLRNEVSRINFCRILVKNCDPVDIFSGRL